MLSYCSVFLPGCYCIPSLPVFYCLFQVFGILFSCLNHSCLAYKLCPCYNFSYLLCFSPFSACVSLCSMLPLFFRLCLFYASACPCYNVGSFLSFRLFAPPGRGGGFSTLCVIPAMALSCLYLSSIFVWLHVSAWHFSISRARWGCLLMLWFCSLYPPSQWSYLS